MKDIQFEKWLVCNNIQQLIPIKVLKTQLKQGVCLPRICVYVKGWDDSLDALSVCQVNKPNYEYDKFYVRPSSKVIN